MEDNQNYELQLHAFDWTVEDKATNEDTPSIHIWCLDRQSVPHLVRVENFLPTCFLQLPEIVNGDLFK